MKERLEIRTRGEEWNLFRNLNPVGWYKVIKYFNKKK